MALAAASNKHKHHQIAFSPPSQIMSNYASFGPATSNPYWHAGKPNNAPFPFVHDTRFHHKLPEPHHQPLQQVMPSVHPSILTPFIEQVQIKQKQAAAAEQKNAVKQSQEATSHENNGSFEIVNDVFSKHLVPPPPNPSKSRPEKGEKLNKYNLSMQSPLQDASRFNYENVVSSATPASTGESLRFKPSASDFHYLTTDKPNVFVHLNNRTKENVYKQHKLLHPSYTGKPKRPSVVVEKPQQKPFLPTPYRPEKEQHVVQQGFEPNHSYFTIEDAVTPNLRYEVVKSHIPVDEEPEIISIYEPSKRPATFEQAATLAYSSTTTTEPPREISTPKPRQKLRRRKPKPQKPSTTSTTAEEVKELTTIRPTRLRGNIKAGDSHVDQSDLRTRNRVNHPNRVRNRPNFSSPAATLSTADYDSTIRSSTEEEKRSESTTATEATSTQAESSEQPETGVKRRVRLRYKNKLRTNTLEGVDFKPKLSDNTISDTEHDSIVVKHQSAETTDSSLVTESGIGDIRSSLKLPNLKLRHEALTTLPTTADTISTSVQPSSTTSAEHDDNSILNKIANRPRFSIKEYKRKQVTLTTPASTVLTSVSTAAPTTKVDNQRFNRLRVSLTRRRNETNDSGEEAELPRKRYSTQRPTTTTTESTTQTTAKRITLPKRTFPPRNFTKPTVNVAETESTTTSLKPIKNATNRPPTQSLRSRIQSYKKKESSNEVVEPPPEVIRNVNLSAETTVTQELPSTTSTESPARHETSIMKIAKSTSSESKATTHQLFDEVTDASSSADFDLTGSPSEHSQRVAELTISGNDATFKSANIGPLSRRIPNYFTISTDDPILPIQAFFPQINTNENVSRR